MLIEGSYARRGGNGHGRFVFPDSERVIFFDVDGVLLLQKGTYEHGRRNGRDRYRLHNQAREVVSKVIRVSHRVVAWTVSENAYKSLIDYSGSFPFSDIDLFVCGADLRNGTAYKNMRHFSGDVGNTVGIQDYGNGESVDFLPKRRVVNLRPHEDLMEKYLEALELFS